MTAYHLLAVQAVQWAGFGALTVLLWVRRRRAPRAAGFALLLVATLALLAAVRPAYTLAYKPQRATPPRAVYRALVWSLWANSVAHPLAVVLLPVAAMTDRRPAGGRP